MFVKSLILSPTKIVSVSILGEIINLRDETIALCEKDIPISKVYTKDELEQFLNKEQKSIAHKTDSRLDYFVKQHESDNVTYPSQHGLTDQNTEDKALPDATRLENEFGNVHFTTEDSFTEDEAYRKNRSEGFLPVPPRGWEKGWKKYIVNFEPSMQKLIMQRYREGKEKGKKGIMEEARIAVSIPDLTEFNEPVHDEETGRAITDRDQGRKNTVIETKLDAPDKSSFVQLHDRLYNPQVHQGRFAIFYCLNPQAWKKAWIAEQNKPKAEQDERYDLNYWRQRGMRVVFDKRTCDDACAEIDRAFALLQQIEQENLELS